MQTSTLLPNRPVNARATNHHTLTIRRTSHSTNLATRAFPDTPATTNHRTRTIPHTSHSTGLATSTLTMRRTSHSTGRPTRALPIARNHRASKLATHHTH